MHKASRRDRYGRRREIEKRERPIEIAIASERASGGVNKRDERARGSVTTRLFKQNGFLA